MLRRPAVVAERFIAGGGGAIWEEEHRFEASSAFQEGERRVGNRVFYGTQ